MNPLFVKNHFKISELFKNESPYQINKAIQDGYISTNVYNLHVRLNLLREVFGYAITITSGYRNPVHNERVQGSPTSLHISGAAADICPSTSSKTIVELLNSIIELQRRYTLPIFGQVIYYPERGFIHVALPTTFHNKLHIYVKHNNDPKYYDYEQRNN